MGVFTYTLGMVGVSSSSTSSTRPARRPTAIKIRMTKRQAEFTGSRRSERGRAFLLAAILGCVPCVMAPGCDEENDRPEGPSNGMLTFDAGALGRMGGQTGGASGDAAVGGAGGTGGAVGGGSRCEGFATACLLRTPSTCTSGQGCRLDGNCEGFRSCRSEFSRFACERVDGCSWDLSFDDCGGVPWSCSSYLTSVSCPDGCSWEEDCGGVAAPCNLLTTAACLSQPGCRLASP